MMRVLAIGECMGELAPTGMGGDLRLGFAGDTFNTVWYLSRLAPQVQVSYLTAVGDDAISDQMKTFIADSGIDDRFVQVQSGKTVGLYVITLDQGERSFSYWRGQSAAKSLADDPVQLDAAMAAADVIYVSGITLAILPAAGRAHLIAALSAARATGKTIAFDPNLRPRLWASDPEMTATIMQGAAVSDIVLPSFEDEALWFDDANPQATAKRYLAAGATTVIVKNGGDPVFYVHEGTAGEIAVQTVGALVDSTAAGDAFNAGFFARHCAGQTPAGAIKYACALSRLVVQQRGALVDIQPQDLPDIPPLERPQHAEPSARIGH